MRTGLVLGGGGARGAYEAGVLSYLREEFDPEFGRPVPVDIIAGTSVGAINACHVAAHIEEPREQAIQMVNHWKALSIDSVLRFGAGDIFRMAREVFGKPALIEGKHGGLIDPSGLQGIVLRGAPWPAIGRSIRRGALHAMAISATHVATGRTTVFIQMKGKTLPPWTNDPHFVAEPALIGPHHAMASAAIPLLFPPVRVRGRLYVDGSLRQSVPIAPALRLGAQRVLVISLRHLKEGVFPPQESETLEEGTWASAPFLFGKTLNALLLDRTDQDMEKLRRLNTILVAGTEAFGGRYPEVLNAAMRPHRNSPLRYVRNILIRPSEDIGQLASQYARSPDFTKRARGLAGAFVRKLVEREARESADLVSYLLFDGGFAEQLIDLGRRDARAQREGWARFFSDAPECETEAVQMETDTHQPVS
jgi:NTE family protein